MTRPDEQYVLTPHEMLLSANVGTVRNVEDITEGRHHLLGDLTTPFGNGWNGNIEGACGEWAVSRYTGRQYLGVGTMGGDDVGSGLQVRTTGDPNGYLTVRRKDHPDKVYVLVVGKAPRLTLRGWLYGYEMKRDEWWSDPYQRNHWAWYVPQDALRPMVDLVR